MKTEVRTKHKRVVEFMSKHQLGAVALSGRPNFAWLTGGKLSHVNSAAQEGVATLIVTPEEIVCVSSNIERPRLADEELADAGMALVDHSWCDGAGRKRVIDDLIGGVNVAYDVAGPGLPDRAKPLPGEFCQLRWSLLADEVQRYKQAGQVAAAAMEAALAEVTPGMTENEIAARAAAHVYDRSARPWVILVAADERIVRYRHPIPTDRRLDRIVMLVLCVEKHGLLCSLTRLVSFKPIDEKLRGLHQAVTRVDAAMCLCSQPGKTLGDMFDTAERAYAEVDFADEWRLHHQGGPTGYTTRDAVATAGNPAKLVANQAFAWNPSITGTKSEDTIILTDADPIIVTAASPEWPMTHPDHAGRTLPRPDILERT